MRRGSGWGSLRAYRSGKGGERRKRTSDLHRGYPERGAGGLQPESAVLSGHRACAGGASGEGLLEEEAFLEQALAEMEDNRMLGSGCYVFSCKEPEVFLKLDGSEVDSLGEYLAGVYKNRPSDQREDAVTLQEVYTAWHDRGELPPLPAVTLGENQKILVDNPD